MTTRFNAELLQRVRLDLGLTQESAALRLGVDVRTYRRYESGVVNQSKRGFSVRHPSRKKLLAQIATEFGIATEELVVEATEPPPSPEPDRPTATWAPRVVHPLQRARHFVGRADLLERLTTWHADDQPQVRVVALVAVGGTGKTALAERFLQEATRDLRAGVFVWSFYEDRRTEAFVEQALAYFAPGAEDTGVGGRLERLLTVLGQGPPHLLVLDGLETVQADRTSERAHGELEDPLLRRLVRAIGSGLGGARALITSRFELADLRDWEGTGLETHALTELEPADAQALLRAWGISGDRPALDALLDDVGRHALSVAMTGSYVGAFLDGDPARLAAVSLSDAAQDDPLARRLARVLGSYAKALSERERDLLARMAVFPHGVDLAALKGLAAAGDGVAGALVGADGSGLLKDLSRLEHLGLVFRSRPQPPSWSTHPFVRQHFRSLLGVDPIAIHETERERLLADLAKRPGPADSPALLDRYEALLLHTLRAGRPLEACELYDDKMGGFSFLGLNRGDMSRGERVIRTFARAGDPTQLDARLPVDVRARLAYDWGLYAGALGDLHLACRCYEFHNRLWGGGRNPDTVMGLRTLAYTERLRGRLARAEELLETSIALSQEAGWDAAILRGISLRGLVRHERGYDEGAEADFKRARALEGGELVARRGLWEAERNLRRGDHTAASLQTLENLAYCESLEWGGHVAHCHTILGLAALDAGDDPQVAAGHLAEAVRWTERTGEAEMLLRCTVLAARIAKADDDPETAHEAVTRGLDLARQHGFRLFEVDLLRLSGERETGNALARELGYAG